MQFSEDQNRTAIRINAWDTGRITINGKEHNKDMLLSVDQIEDFEVPEFEQLTSETIHSICQLNPEVLLLGTGKEQRFPDMSIRNAALQAGLSLEVMDTMAACRTFSLLNSEGRRVFALLYMK